MRSCPESDPTRNLQSKFRGDLWLGAHPCLDTRMARLEAPQSGKDNRVRGTVRQLETGAGSAGGSWEVFRRPTSGQMVCLSLRLDSGLW
jgi:hypothetical protein